MNSRQARESTGDQTKRRRWGVGLACVALLIASCANDGRTSEAFETTHTGETSRSSAQPTEELGAPLVDFADADEVATWTTINDPVMGGLSTSSVRFGNGGLVFSGSISLENNGGFASVRSGPVRENLTGLTAFVLRVRGDGRGYKFSVRTGASFNSQLYQTSFTTKQGEWEEHRLAFSDFVPTFRGRILTDVPLLNPAKVNSVGFLISDKQAGPFRLEIGWIKASPAGR